MSKIKVLYVPCVSEICNKFHDLWWCDKPVRVLVHQTKQLVHDLKQDIISLLLLPLLMLSSASAKLLSFFVVQLKSIKA